MIEKTYADAPSFAYNRIAAGLRRWRESTVQAVALIVEAKEREIWKLKYGSLQEFCDKECGISRRWLFELCDTSRTIREIADVAGINLDGPPSDDARIPAKILAELTPKQAAPLKGLPPADKAAVLATSIERSGGKSPAPRVIAAEATNRIAINGKAAEKLVLDETGYPIPERALPYWNRSQEIQDILSDLSGIKGVIERAQESDDPMWREVDFSGAIATIGLLWTKVKTAKPYAVCAYCQGMTPDKCTFCRGRGLISKFRWDTSVPTELKAIRARGIEKLKESK